MTDREPEKFVSSPIPYVSTTIRDGFIVPMRQALFTALLSGGAACGVVVFVVWGLILAEIDIPVKWCVYAALLAFAVVFFPVAIITWKRAKEDWMYIIENAMLMDLNQDGMIGDPGKQEPPAPKLRVTVNNGQQRPMDRDEIEDDEIPFADRLPLLARALAGGKPFTYSEWGGKGKLFSQPEWVTLTDTLRERGYIRYRNPKATHLGYDFTHKGGAFMQSLIEEGIRIEKEAVTQIPMSQSPFSPYPRAGSVRN